MSLIKNLNTDQKKAVTFEGGPLLVLAGAGSGKTRVLIYRVAYLIKKRLISPQNALLLTFTNKAADEMKKRIAGLVDSAPYFSGTFHAFCARTLRIDGKEANIDNNFVIYDERDSKDAIQQILDNLSISKDSFKPSSVLSAISEAKSKMIKPLTYGEIARGDWQKKVFKIYVNYEKLLKKNNALDFDDLLLKTVYLFRDSPETLDKWKNRLTHVFVDEWQDTNKIQYELIKLLVGDGKGLTVVGDASQSIYSWRGANYRNINQLQKDFPELTVINLEQNYRSTQNILTAANAVISKNTLHPILNLWTKNDEGEKIKIFRAKSGLEEASFVISESIKLTKNGFTHKDVAILYRTNAQSRIFEEAMLHQGVPYALVGGTRFYDRAEVKDVLALLRALVNPKDTVSINRIEKLGVRRKQKFEELKDSITPSLKEMSTLEIMDTVLEKTNYLSKYKRESEENLSRLENIKELRSVATEFPEIHNFLENVALVQGNELSSQSSGNNNSVTLMTLHAAKGLEYPVVFVVGLEEGLFPHSRSLYDAEQLEEERRLAYVGMTRAEKLLYLSFANKRLYFGQRTANPPSRFLIDIPEDLLETTDN